MASKPDIRDFTRRELAGALISLGEKGSKADKIFNCLYRKGAEAGLISNTLEWFDFHKARNETAHTYNEGKAEEVYTEAGKFLIRAKELLAELRLRKDAKP